MNEEFDINNLIEESLYSDMPDNALDTNNYKSRSLARAKALRRLYYTNLRQSTESSIYTPTYMGEYTGTQSRFDEGLSVIPIMADPNYLNEQRAARQPFLEQLGKGVVHFGADIVGGVIMGAGVLVEPLDSAIKAAVGVENEYGNIIFDIGRTIAEGSKEAFPIYSTGIGSSGWAIQGLSSIGSAVASLFTGMGVMGLLGKVGTVLKMTDTAMDVFNIASRVAGAAAMRLQENMQEGIGVAEDIIKQGEDLLNKKAYYENFVYPYQNKQYQETLEKLRAVNDPKAMNLPDQLPVPNLLGDYKIKNMDDVYKAAEIGYWTSQKVNAANFVFDFIQLGALSKFNKAIPSFGKIFTPSELLKAQGTQFENKYLRGLNWLLTRPALAESTEAIEEGINFIGEQEGRRAATLMLKGKTDLDDGTDFKERLKGYLGMSEFWDSAFWGFVAGIGGYYVMKGAGFNDHAEDLKQRTAEIAARQKQLNTFIPQVNAIIEGGKYTDPTTGEAEDYSTWDAEKRWEFLTTKTRQMGFDFGMSAARAGNADLLKHKKYIDDVMDRIMQQDAAKDKKSQIQQNEEEVLARKADLKKALMEGLDAGVRSYELAAKTFRYRTKDPVVMGHLINSYANVKLRLEEITKQLNKHDTKIAELSKEYYDHLANLGLNINPTEKDAFLKIVGISTAINYLNKHKQTLQETANKLKNSKSQNTEALNNLIEQIKGVDEMIKSLTDDKNKLSKDMEAFFQSMDKSLKEKNITVKDIINGNFINKGINPDLVDAVINKTILEKTREHLTKRLIDLTNDETIKRTEDAANELRNKQKENLSKAKKRYSFIEKKSKKDEKYINNLEDAVISLVGDDKALENRIEDAKKEKPHLAPFLDDLLYVMKTIGALTHANTIEELDMIRDALLNNPELLNYKDIVDNVYQTTKNRINNGDNTSTQPTAPTTTPEPSPAPTPTASNQSNQGQNTQTEPEDENGTEPEPEPKSEPEPEPEPTELFDGDGNYIGGNNASQNEDNTNTTGQPEPTPQPTIPSPKPKPKPVKTITLARISRSFSEIDTKHREQLKNELAKINAEFLKNNRDIQNAEDKNWYRAQITEAYNNFINSLLADLESASSTTYTILDKEKGLEALLKQKESSMLAQQTKQSVTTKEPTVVSPTQSFSFKTVTYKISGLAGSLVKFINNINKVIQNEFARDNYSKIMPEESNEELLRDIVLTVGFVVSKSETTTPSPYSHLIMEAIQENGVVLRVNEEMLISPENENNIFTIHYASGHSEKLTGRQYYNKLQELKKTNYTEYLDIVPIQVITQIKRGNETIELEVASLRTTGFLKASFGQNNNLTLRIRSIRQMVLNKPLSLKVKNIKTGRFVNVGDVNTAKLLTELMTPNTPMNIGFIDANGTVSYYDHRTNSTSTSIKLTNIQIKSFPGVNIDEIPVGTPAFVIPNMDSKGKAVVIPLLTVNKEFSNETSQAVSFWLNNLATKFESLAQSKKSMSVSSIIDELKSLFYFVDYREINQNKAWNYDTDPRIRFTANLNDSKNAVFIFKVLDQSVELQVNDKNFLSNLSNLIRSINTLNFMPNINWDLFKKSSEYRDVVVRLFASSVLGHIEATSGERIFYGDNGIVLDFDSRSGMKDYFALVNSGGTIKKPESTPTTKVPVVDHRTSKESTEGTKKPKSKEKTKSKKPEGTNTTKIDPSKLSVQSNQGNPTTKPSDEGDPFGFSGLFDEDAALNNFKKKGKGGKTIGDGC